MDQAAGLAFAVDGATAAAGAFNAAWFVAQSARRTTRARRNAMLVLACVNAGIALQASFAQALYTAHRFAWPVAPFFTPAAWLGPRLPLLAGTLLISMLILRRRPR